MIEGIDSKDRVFGINKPVVKKSEIIALKEQIENLHSRIIKLEKAQMTAVKKPAVKKPAVKKVIKKAV